MTLLTVQNPVTVSINLTPMLMLNKGNRPCLESEEPAYFKITVFSLNTVTGSLEALELVDDIATREHAELIINWFKVKYSENKPRVI